MDIAHQAGDEQNKLWNGHAGCAWVDAQGLLDQLYKPLEELLVEVVPAAFEGSVLDVGCGTGGTTVAVARRLGANGRCAGIDISEAMIAAARARATRERTSADFICANAQLHAFEPARFDRFISRFGVMFFDDPIQAFANLRRAARHDATFRFTAWRGAADNPFMTTAERAAAPLMPNLPRRRPDAPGQLAFANSQRVRSILEESGWTEVDIQPIDVGCAFPKSELVGYFTRFGPVGLALQEADDQTRTRVIETVRLAFEPFVHEDEVRFTAACWMVDARADR